MKFWTSDVTDILAKPCVYLCPRKLSESELKHMSANVVEEMSGQHGVQITAIAGCF